jgi:hypothetical protein
MIFNKLFGPFLKRPIVLSRISGLRFYGSPSHSAPNQAIDLDKDGHPYTDNESRPFGLEPGDPIDWNRRIYVTFYLGGLALFLFIYQYVPDTSYVYSLPF